MEERTKLSEHIGKSFQGIVEASEVTGIPQDALLLARIRIKSLPLAECNKLTGSNGFHVSGRIYWTEVLCNWITAHLTELQTVGEDENKNYWDTRKARASALLEELDLEERTGRLVNKQAGYKLLERIAAAQVSLFNGKLRQELPARLNLPPEKIAEIDKVITELFGVMQRGLDQWKK